MSLITRTCASLGLRMKFKTLFMKSKPKADKVASKQNKQNKQTTIFWIPELNDVVLVVHLRPVRHPLKLHGVDSNWELCNTKVINLGLIMSDEIGRFDWSPLWMYDNGCTWAKENSHYFNFPVSCIYQTLGPPGSWLWGPRPGPEKLQIMFLMCLRFKCNCSYNLFIYLLIYIGTNLILSVVK